LLYLLFCLKNCFRNLRINNLALVDNPAPVEKPAPMDDPASMDDPAPMDYIISQVKEWIHQYIATATVGIATIRSPAHVDSPAPVDNPAPMDSPAPWTTLLLRTARLLGTTPHLRTYLPGGNRTPWRPSR
jgi:hypothetical protein